jgi:hypothetical protein
VTSVLFAHALTTPLPHLPSACSLLADDAPTLSAPATHLGVNESFIVQVSFPQAPSSFSPADIYVLAGQAQVDTQALSGSSSSRFVHTLTPPPPYRSRSPPWQTRQCPFSWWTMTSGAHMPSGARRTSSTCTTHQRGLALLVRGRSSRVAMRYTRGMRGLGVAAREKVAWYPTLSALITPPRTTHHPPPLPLLAVVTTTLAGPQTFNSTPAWFFVNVLFSGVVQGFFPSTTVVVMSWWWCVSLAACAGWLTASVLRAGTLWWSLFSDVPAPPPRLHPPTRQVRSL